MNITPKNYISYEGTINIKLKTPEGNIFPIYEGHNEGTRHLGLFVAKCLQGNLDENKLPAFVDFTYGVTGEINIISPNIGTSALSSPVSISTSTYNVGLSSSGSDTELGNIVFTAAISDANANIDSPTNFALILKSKDGSVLAILKDVDDILAEIYDKLKTLSYSAIIDWKLSINNVVS